MSRRWPDWDPATDHTRGRNAAGHASARRAIFAVSVFGGRRLAEVSTLLVATYAGTLPKGRKVPRRSRCRQGPERPASASKLRTRRTIRCVDSFPIFAPDGQQRASRGARRACSRSSTAGRMPPALSPSTGTSSEPRKASASCARSSAQQAPRPTDRATSASGTSATRPSAPVKTWTSSRSGSTSRSASRWRTTGTFRTSRS